MQAPKPSVKLGPVGPDDSLTITSFSLQRSLLAQAYRRAKAFGHKNFSAYVRALIRADIEARPISEGTYGNPAQTTFCEAEARQLSLWGES